MFVFYVYSKLQHDNSDHFNIKPLICRKGVVNIEVLLDTSIHICRRITSHEITCITRVLISQWYHC